MLSLDDHIEYYTDPHFDASQSAQQIFASYGETEIAKKLNDMSKIQSSIETILKTNVKENYPTFLQATEQVNQVGQEMSELKILIENTKKLINVIYLILSPFSLGLFYYYFFLFVVGCSWYKDIRITCYAN